MTSLTDALGDVPVIGILRGCPPEHVVAVAKAAVTAGIGAVEITMDSPDVTRQLLSLRDALGDNVALGAGTIGSTVDVDAAIGAGASFGVAPDLQLDVLAHALSMGMAYVPGAMTPTEIAAAHRAGATYVKVFPSIALGASFIRALRGPMPTVPIVCTGGVGAELARDLLDAGANAVGVSGDVFSSEAMSTGDAAAVGAAAERFLRIATGR